MAVLKMRSKIFKSAEKIQFNVHEIRMEWNPKVSVEATALAVESQLHFSQVLSTWEVMCIECLRNFLLPMPLENIMKEFYSLPALYKDVV